RAGGVRGGAADRERAARAAGAGLAVLGTAVAAATWMRGIGGLATVPQEHDTVVHTLLTGYVGRTGEGAPWQLLPIDVITGEPVYFYPSGMHLSAAVTADLAGGTVPGFNAVTVVLLAVALSASAAALTFVAARRLRLGQGPAALAAGAATVVAAGLYRPAYQLAHDGGALPNAAALALAPGVVAGLLLLPREPRRTAVAVALACAGAVWVHPSAAVTIGVTAVAWWCGDAFAPALRRELRRLPGPLLVTGGLAAVLLVPLVASSATAAARTSGFPADTAPVGYGDAVGSTLGLAYGGYLDPPRATGQLWAAVLVAVGIAAVVALRRGYGPVAAWAAWVAVTIAYFLSPSTGPETVVTSFFYKGLVRVWSHVSLLAPVLAALGVVICAARVVVLVRRRARRLPVCATTAVAVVVAAVLAAYAAGPGRVYAVRAGDALATRYSEPAFVRVDADDERAGEWLAARVRPGERVMNSANDGSTFLYVEHGVPVVNVYPLGLPQAPYTYELLQRFDRYPTDPAVRELLVELDVAWVYVDERAPRIGAAGSPEDWAGDGPFDLAPGLQRLDGLPGLREEFRSGTVRVYSLDLDLLAAWPSGA
ncbi:MAG TPA: DUF6541 family protein, partial [Pseudonocardia sp.]|nr:DUF6541 family protein [Pseudonocardia sp.]